MIIKIMRDTGKIFGRMLYALFVGMFIVVNILLKVTIVNTI